MDNENQNTMEQTEVKSFKCPSCGSDLVFDPVLQKLKCPYCGNVVEIDGEKVSENAFKGVLDDSHYSNDVEVFRCSNCGALSEKTSADISVECPYCHKTVVTEEKEVKGIKPDGVVSFKLDVKTAAQKAKAWLKSRFYAKGKMKKTDFDTLLKGYYYPCWTFDANTYSTYQGRVGKRVTRTKGSGKNRRTVTEIRWRNISGSDESAFDDIVVYSGKDFTGGKFDRVSGFDTNHAEKYDKSYLAGFAAMHYTKDFESSWSEAKANIDDIIRKSILSRYDCDVVDYLNVNTSYSDTKYKYVLLPFYVGGYAFGGKNYNVVVNGESGRTYGKYPISVPKVILTVILGLLAVAGILYFLSVFEGV